MSTFRTVSLPEALCQAAEKKFAARFQSIEELLAELLTQLLQDDALAMDQNEQRIIEDRLKALGYV